MKVKQYTAYTLIVFVLALSYAQAFWEVTEASAQAPDGTDRANAKEMLHNVINDLKNNYFDPDYLKQIGLDVRARAAEKRIDQAQSVFQLYGIIGQILGDFDEPGTFFIPPTIELLRSLESIS